eukprot:CAMPEP_0181186294 /NCGR_PEP_ID=MMETSP1096-20121128/9958_1 /TAXON_ID=156174 ORGANISM="Chrysochromulina ericina, Strain CCMP281" /NCGR_SAMPLE_ID=MMETSP1096 /ASSEMBLY_ACC=CAM_ASM_000453 /LENGTH=62 /DNA_ID=CAMNT_0023275183 /DNA_START=485 /DNA_END=676 /DNA_ORIENTATION=+
MPPADIGAKDRCALAWWALQADTHPYCLREHDIRLPSQRRLAIAPTVLPEVVCASLIRGRLV